MIGWGRVRLAARLLCAAAIPVAASAPASDQVPDPAALDPSAPLDPLPDLGVEWPELDAEPIALPPVSGDNSAVTRSSTPDPAIARSFAVALEGLDVVSDRQALEDSFAELSALRRDGDERANAAQIDLRSRTDAELLAELLRSRGYYDAIVEPRTVLGPETLLVVIEAEPGARYRFESVELPGLATAGEAAAGLRDAFAIRSGDPVIAADVIAAGAALRIALGEQGFALAEVGEQQIVLDHESRSASLVLPVNPGPMARFGEVRVTGQPPFSPGHVATIARFQPGEPFRRSRVDDLRRALIATGLVSFAEVQVVPAADGRTVDLAVRLEPAPLRTIAGELGYSTGEGVRIEGSWQHRNLINPEGALTVRGIAGTLEQAAGIEFRRNNFRGRDQVLTLNALASSVDRDAYEARTLLLGAGIERQSNIIWPKTWTWGFGIDLIATDERGVFTDPSQKEARTFLIAAVPAHLRYDGSDDLLNPTHGFRLGGRVSPELSAHGGSFSYLRSQLDGSAYRSIASGTVLAGRVRLATISGADLSSIAPSRRLYAGGGSSVRGYGYQQLGPRDSEGDPVGGRGLAEFSLEARVPLRAFGGSFGIVPFLDGGTLSTASLPDLDGWQFGAGLGLRYYSSFGPIRLDVGAPLNPREGDAPVAVTVSLGQAF